MLVLKPIIEFTPVAWLQARITQASTNGITYFRRSSDSLTLVPVELFSAAAVCSISANSTSACSFVRERSSAAYAASLFPRRNNHRGDSDTIRLPITNKIPGGSDTQKMLRQAASLNANSRDRSPS